MILGTTNHNHTQTVVLLLHPIPHQPRIHQNTMSSGFLTTQTFIDLHKYSYTPLFLVYSSGLSPPLPGYPSPFPLSSSALLFLSTVHYLFYSCPIFPLFTPLIYVNFTETTTSTDHIHPCCCRRDGDDPFKTK